MMMMVVATAALVVRTMMLDDHSSPVASSFPMPNFMCCTARRSQGGQSNYQQYIPTDYKQYIPGPRGRLESHAGSAEI